MGVLDKGGRKGNLMRLRVRTEKEVDVEYVWASRKWEAKIRMSELGLIE